MSKKPLSLKLTLFIMLLLLISCLSIFMVFTTPNESASAIVYNSLDLKRTDFSLYTDDFLNTFSVETDIFMQSLEIKDIEIRMFSQSYLMYSFFLEFRVINGFFYISCRYKDIALDDFVYNLELFNTPFYKNSQGFFKVTFVFQKIYSNFRLYFKFNDKFLGSKYFSDFFYNQYENISLNIYNYDLNNNLIYLDQIASYYTIGIIESGSAVSKFQLDFSNFEQSSYDVGYIKGANSVKSSTLNIFPSAIGSVLNFFLIIAQYEFLGISVLNLMIVFGSLLLSLFLIRVVLK